MAAPRKLHGPAFYRHLSALRDEALVASNTYGQRLRIGRFVVGSARAEWTTAGRGIGILRDRGMRIGGETLGKARPTRLVFCDAHRQGNVQVTDFEMDLDGVQAIEVQSYLVTTGGLRDALQAKHAKSVSHQQEQATPTDQQLMRICSELERAATGDYRLHTSYIDGAVPP